MICISALAALMAFAFNVSSSEELTQLFANANALAAAAATALRAAAAASLQKPVVATHTALAAPLY